MKNTLKTLLAIAVLGAATAVSAITIPSTGSVEIANTPNDGGLTGGAFASRLGGIGGTELYTFCLEKGTSLHLLSGDYNYKTYNYALSNATAPDGDVISEGTAFLVEEYAHNGPAIHTTSAQIDLEAGMMQLAIWALEGEFGNYDLLGDNIYVNLIESTFGSLAAAMGDYTGTKVRVMQITSALTGDALQDQVIYVPDSGATLAFLGLGLAGLALARRRR